MAGWALAFLCLYLVFEFGLRILAHKVRTGSTGFNGIGGEAGSLEWWGGALFALSPALGALAPVLDLAGVLDPIGVLDGRFGHQAGGGMFWGGLISTLLAQISMGDSWRIGVDPREKTEQRENRATASTTTPGTTWSTTSTIASTGTSGPM